MIGILLALLSVLGFAASFILARVGMRSVPSSTATLISLLSGSLVLWTFALLLSSEGDLQFENRTMGLLLLSGLLNFPIGRVCNYVGVRLAGASRSTTIISAAPLAAMVLAVAFGGESVNALVLFGTVSIVAGVTLIVTQNVVVTEH